MYCHKEVDKKREEIVYDLIFVLTEMRDVKNSFELGKTIPNYEPK
jgi:hypothetical protein